MRRNKNRGTIKVHINGDNKKMSEYIHKSHNVLFLIQLVPSFSPTNIVKLIKSINVREIYRLYPEVNKKLWEENIRSAVYFVSTVEKNDIFH